MREKKRWTIIWPWTLKVQQLERHNEFLASELDKSRRKLKEAEESRDDNNEMLKRVFADKEHLQEIVRDQKARLSSAARVLKNIANQADEGLRYAGTGGSDD